MKQSVFTRLAAKIKLRLKRLLPNCKTITATLSQSLDRRLSVREKLVAALHLFTCEACAIYLKQIKFLREAIQLREKSIVREEDSGVCEI